MSLKTANLEVPGYYWSRYEGDTFVVLVERDRGDEWVCLRDGGLKERIPADAEFIGPLLDPFLPNCEHGVADGDYCEPCNKEYKAAATDPDNDR